MSQTNTQKFYPLLTEEEPMAKIIVDEVNRQHARRYDIEDVSMYFDTGSSNITFNIGDEFMVDVNRESIPKNVVVFNSKETIPLSLTDAMKNRLSDLTEVLTDLNESLYEITQTRSI